MSRFSLRTLMLAMLGAGLLCALFTNVGLKFTAAGWSVSVAHLLLVVAFAAPAGSWAFDRTPTHRAVVLGTCLGAIVGTLSLSAAVLALDVIRLFH